MRAKHSRRCHALCWTTLCAAAVFLISCVATWIGNSNHELQSLARIENIDFVYRRDWMNGRVQIIWVHQHTGH